MTGIFSQVLNMSLTGSAVIVTVLLARLILKKSPKVFSYALWAVVLFRLLCPVSLTGPVSLLELFRPQILETTDRTGIVYYLPVVEKDAAELTFVPPQTSGEEKTSFMEKDVKPSLSPMEAMGGIWIVGACAMLLYSAVQYFLLRRRLVGAMVLRENVYLADHIDTPFVMGFLPPRIYLPSHIPPEERKYIIAHEKHHIRRFDHGIKGLAYLALCVHWFNPLVWVAFILAGKDMEMSCDEAVIRKLGPQIRADYSASLLRLATHRRIIAGMPLAFGEGDTKGRVLNMAKWKKPSLWVSILCLTLCVAVLGACALNPEEQEAGTDEAQLLENCRQVLQQIRESEAYEIITERENYGTDVLNNTSTFHVWRHGEDWLKIDTVPEDTISAIFAYMYVEERWYEGTSFVEDGISTGIEWREGTDPGVSFPWLAEYVWEDGEVTLDSVEDTGSGTVVHLSIRAPFNLGELTAEEYTINFIFDADGNFLAARVSVGFPNGFMIVETQRIVTLERDLVELQILMNHPDAEADNRVATDSLLVKYGSLNLLLTGEYGCREEGDGIVLTREGSDVGGISCYGAPEFELKLGENMSEWVQALGLPELTVDFGGPVGHMIGSTQYGDLEAEIFLETDPAKLNREHHFYLVGDQVYDVWYDQNLLTDGAAEKLLMTVAIGGEETAPRLQDQGDALEKCLTVLRAVQGGSCGIVTDRDNNEQEPASGFHQEYFRHGQDRLSVTTVLTGGESYVEGKEYPLRKSSLCVDGKHYGFTGSEWEPVADGVQSNVPWLDSFCWNAEKVFLMDTLKEEKGETVMLRVDEKYVDSEAYEDHYFVNFHFDPEGALRSVKVQVNLFREDGFTAEESILTLAEQEVSERIHRESLLCQ